MPNFIFRGDSPPVAQVTRVTPANVVIGDVFRIFCNGKMVSYVAQAATAQDVVTGLVAALQKTTIGEFAEMLASDSGSGYVSIVAVTAGVPFEITASTSVTSAGNVIVTEVTPGQSAVNEVWKIALVGNYTGGNFTLTVNVGGGNVTTANIAFNATAATVQAALVALAGVGAGQVIVTGGPGPGSPWFVQWAGTLGGQSIAPGTVNGAGLTGNGSVVVSTTTDGNGLSDEIQMLDCSPVISQGAFPFTLTLNGQVTATLNTNMTAAQIQTGLQNLPNVGANNCLVYASPLSDGEPLAYFIHFTGALAATNVSQLVVTWGFPQNPPVVTTLQDGGLASCDEFQFLDLGIAGTGNGAAGTQATFKVTYQGQTTASISNDASAGNNPATKLQTALQGLSAIGAANCTVYGSNGLVGSTSAVMDGFLIRLTGAKANTRGTPFTATCTAGTGPVITRLSMGQANTSEVQTVTVFGTGGTFTLSLNAQTTAALAWNIATGTLQTRIQTDLAATVTGVNVTGAGTVASPYVVTVTTPANTNIAQMTGDGTNLTGGGGTVTEQTAGAAGVNEVQTVAEGTGVNGGTFTLAFLGSVTGALAWNISAASLQAALRALPTINTVTVTGSAGGPYTVTWSGAQGSFPQPLLVGDGTNLTGATGTQTLVVSTTTFSSGPNHYNDPLNWVGARVPDSGGSVFFEAGQTNCLYGLNQLATCIAVSNVQTVTISATGGTFTLTESAQVTGAIAFNASAATLQAAILAAFTNTVTSCVVTGANGGPYSVTLTGPLGNAIPLMTGNGGALTGGAGTVTIVSASNTVAFTSRCDLLNDQIVQITNAGGALPTGLAAATNYYIVSLDRNALTCQLSLTSGGAAVAITAPGTGTNTLGIRLDYLEWDSRYTGQVGLPKVSDSGGYYEYRQRKLHIGLRAAGTQQVVIGPGGGSGSQRLILDTDVDQVIGKLITSGGELESGIPAVLWCGTNAANTWNVIAGDFGAAIFAGETAVLAGPLQIRGGSVELGAGCTMTGKIDQTGGAFKSKGALVNGVTLMA